MAQTEQDKADTTTLGRVKNPTGIARFHTGFALSQQIRRVSEQTSPQVARAVGHPRIGTMAADCAVAAAQSAVFTSGTWAGRGGGSVDQNFTGEHTQKVDSKGRMSIPADFRRVLELGDPAWAPGLTPRMYLLYGDHLTQQLHGYTVAEFTAVVAQINALPRGSERKQILSRLIIGQSIRLDVDKDGRTVMPIKQRQKLGITEGELTFSGLGDHFEIWRSDRFDTDVAQTIAAYLADKPSGFDPLVMLDD